MAEQVKFKVSGIERRWLKKDLARAKAHDKMFWFYEDVNDVYGCGLPPEEAQKRKKELENKIESMQEQLKETC
jgi:hypothetical protein